MLQLFRAPTLPFLLSFAIAAIGCPAIMSADTARLTNLSVRSTAGSGSETLIVGLTVGGAGSKNVLIRGIGPGLRPFGIDQVVTDPKLTLYSSTGVALDRNDNWSTGGPSRTAFESVGAFALATNSLDAALLKSLPPGSYSAQLDASSGKGVALIECYDAEPTTAGSSFTNVSALSGAGTGDDILTVGFSISGTGTRTVLVRGIGPTLANYGVSGTLPSAQVRLYNSAGSQIAINGAWNSEVTPIALFDSVGAFALPKNSRDAVVFLALPPGSYTAQVSGAGSSTGTALVEVYSVDNSPVPFITLHPVTNPSGAAPLDFGVASPGPDINPVVSKQPLPVYPVELWTAGITGDVLVDFYILSNGLVYNAVALNATDSRMAESAVAAISSWIYAPGRRSDRLVAFHYRVPVTFSIGL